MHTVYGGKMQYSHYDPNPHYMCRNPTLRECEDEIHTPEMGTWESSETPKTLEFNYRGQNTLHWGVLYIIGKLSKCRCRKWLHEPFGHLWHKLWQKERSGVKLTV